MFGALTHNGRVWVLLLAWLLFVGLCWADTLDLSDDIVLPVAVGQAAVESEDSDIKSGMVLLLTIIALWTGVPGLSQVSKPVFLSSQAWAAIPPTPLYQRLSTYRI